jgi:hypothetical protein
MRTILAVTVICLAGCSQHDEQVKAHAEEEIERFHEQAEKERAQDAYHRSPEYKEKVYQQLKHGMFGNLKTKGQVIP